MYCFNNYCKSYIKSRTFRWFVICDANLLKDEFENEESNNQNEPT